MVYWQRVPKRDECHGGPSRIGANRGPRIGKDSRETPHEEEALARRRLDRAGWWHRSLDRLSA